MSTLMSCTNRNWIILFALMSLVACTALETPPGKPDAPLSSTPARDDTTAVEAERARYAQVLDDLRSNRLTQAEAALKRLTEERPELAGPWVNLGLIYIKNNQLDQATDMLNRALDNKPELAQARHLLGYIEHKRGHYLQARDLYIQAVSAKPDYAIAHYNLALLYDNYLHDIPKAVEHYKTYLELTGFEDKRTADWLNELALSLNKGQP